jgi:glycine/D-amino acid oxidase-like deaminating enzyme
MRIRIKALVNQLMVTERLRPVMRSVLGIASGFLSLKQFANGTVLIGGGWQGKGDRVRRVTEIVPDNLIGNLRLARYVVPALAETRIVRSWLGFEAETDDALPIVGPLSGIPEAYVIGCVHSGYTSGPYFGRLLAQTILGHVPEMPLFDAGRLLASP